MKITLKNYDARVLFPNGTKIEEINGIHNCMSGAQYIVDVEKKTLTYIGGLSPMFVHSDFPVGDGLSPKDLALDELRYIQGFTIEYSNLTDNYEKSILDWDHTSKIDFDKLLKFIEHIRRIEKNSWECGSKITIKKIMGIALKHYI